MQPGLNFTIDLLQATKIVQYFRCSLPVQSCTCRQSMWNATEPSIEKYLDHEGVQG